MNTMHNRTNKGFTLLEILLVITLIGILSAIALVSINPNRQLAQARNLKRESDINAIYNALEMYTVRNRGVILNTITTSYQEICNTGTESSSSTATSCTGKLDLRVLVPTYITSIPRDTQASTGNTSYEVAKDNKNQISIRAKNAELGQSIAINGPSDILYAKAGAFPSLDLDFASNKSLIDNVSGKNLIDFTRNSIGTYVGADGLIKTAGINEPRFDHDPTTGESLGLLVEEARTNKWSYSTFIDQSAWGKANVNVIPNSFLAPDGTFTASKVIPTSTSGVHRIGRAQTNNVISIASVFAKKGELDWIAINMFDTARGQSWQTNFDLTNGVIGNNNNTYAWITPLSNGWFLCQAGRQANAGASTSIHVLPSNISGFVYDGSHNIWTGDNISGVYLWGLQIENNVTFPTSYIPTPATFTSRSTTATYYDANGTIQTAGIDVARDDAYFPDENGVMKPAGLLLEAAGTNLFPISETYTSWNVDNNATKTTDGTTIAGLTAVKLTSNVDTNALFLEGNNATFSANTTYTASVYHKPGNVDGFWFEARSFADGGTTKIFFNSTTETWSANSGIFNGQPWSVRSEKVEANAWRHSLTFYIATDTAGSLRIGGLAPANTTNVLTGDYGYLAAPQIEASPYPTSYIPTTTATVTRAADMSSSSTVTRSADVAQITGSNFSSWYNNNEGTFFTDMALGFTQDAGNPFIFGGVYYTTVAQSVRTLANTPTIMSGLSNSQTIPSKTAVALKSQDFNVYRNGTLTDSNSSLVYSPTGTQLSINPSLGTKGFISKLTYWPTRLPSSNMQAMTQ